MAIMEDTAPTYSCKTGGLRYIFQNVWNRFKERADTGELFDFPQVSSMLNSNLRTLPAIQIPARVLLYRTD